MAVEQPHHRQRHVERVAQVMVQRVAGQVAGKPAAEQRFHVIERLPQRRQVGAGVACSEQAEDCVADLVGILDVDAVGDVVVVEAIYHIQSAQALGAIVLSPVTESRWRIIPPRRHGTQKQFAAVAQ